MNRGRGDAAFRRAERQGKRRGPHPASGIILRIHVTGIPPVDLSLFSHHPGCTSRLKFERMNVNRTHCRSSVFLMRLRDPGRGGTPHGGGRRHQRMLAGSPQFAELSSAISPPCL
jgi:hypothetical protein